MLYEDEIKKLDNELSSQDIMVLATSSSDRVTARSMSTIYNKGHIYFQTDTRLEKYKQIEENSRVALTFGFTQLEGEASLLGRWEEFPELLELYCQKHKKSYETYKHLDSEVVIAVKVTRAKRWYYKEGVPYEVITDIKNENIVVEKRI